MDNDTLHAIVVFVNYSNGNYDPSNINQDLILLQHWPANQNQYLLKPSWADSIICPTTANVWNPSLTGLFAKNSLNKFWLTGDVYDSLVIVKNWEHYRDSGKIGKAVKDAIDRMDPYFDFSLSKYDKFDPCDIDGDGNRREQDNIVDFIFVIFRFTYSGSTDVIGSYSGIACLGGYGQRFGDSIEIIRDGKKINATRPGSGCISEVHHKWEIGIPAHEFGFHYTYGTTHLDGMGSHDLCGGGIASAIDREKTSWTLGSSNIYNVTTNDSIILRDYVTTGDYAKVFKYGKWFYLENRRRLNYYSSGEFHNWRWTLNEPLLPNQRDSGLLIYRVGSFTEDAYEVLHASGKWNWQQCQSSGRYQITKTPYYNQFIPAVNNRSSSGKSSMSLKNLLVYDENCATIINQYTGDPLNVGN